MHRSVESIIMIAPGIEEDPKREALKGRGKTEAKNEGGMNPLLSCFVFSSRCFGMP